MDTNDLHAAARRAGNHPALENAARAGYAANGLLHLLIAWLAVQLAWAQGGANESADQTGALQTLAATGVGRLLLWVAVGGYLGLGLWQVSEMLLRRSDVSERLKAGGKAVVYLFLAFSSFTWARSGTGSGGKSQNVDFTAALMARPAGRWLVVLVGVGIIAVGAFHVSKGWRRTFLRDLREHPGRWVVRAGSFGYLAKGVALALVGLLFVLAGLREAPDTSTGLDGALRTLLAVPMGQILLTVVALGLAAYAVYSFARAKYARV